MLPKSNKNALTKYSTQKQLNPNLKRKIQLGLRTKDIHFLKLKLQVEDMRYKRLQKKSLT